MTPNQVVAFFEDATFYKHKYACISMDPILVINLNAPAQNAIHVCSFTHYGILKYRVLNDNLTCHDCKYDLSNHPNFKHLQTMLAIVYNRHNLTCALNDYGIIPSREEL